LGRDNDRNQVDCYRQYTGLGEDDAPTMKDNLKYAIGLPGLLDVPALLPLTIPASRTTPGLRQRTGRNFVTGISFIDNYFYGDQSKMPDSIHKNNKSYNRLYMLPSSLAPRACLPVQTQRRDFLITGLLFAITGFRHRLLSQPGGYHARGTRRTTPSAVP